jgi:hypothetical protein
VTVCKFLTSETADLCGRGSKQPLDCWDHGFESDSSSLVFVVVCADTNLCDGLITRPEKPYRV